MRNLHCALLSADTAIHSVGRMLEVKQYERLQLQLQNQTSSTSGRVWRRLLCCMWIGAVAGLYHSGLQRWLHSLDMLMHIHQSSMLLLLLPNGVLLCQY